MNYMERMQMAYEYARRSEGFLKSLMQSFGSQSTAQLAVKSGRDETARIMMEMATKPAYTYIGDQSEMMERLGRACFGNGDLAVHYLEQVKAFSESCDHSREQAMQAVAELYHVRAPQLQPPTTVTGNVWDNQAEWDACVVQNPEMAAVSPYTNQTNYAAALQESQTRQHGYLQDKLQQRAFDSPDACRMLMQDTSIEKTMDDYKEMVMQQPSSSHYLPKEVLQSESFRDTLLETDPIRAIRTIPKDQQSDMMRLKAISKDATAYRWIDDDDFKRRHFVMAEMKPMRIGSQPTPEQCERLQQKAAAMYKALESGDKEKRDAFAEQNWMPMEQTSSQQRQNVAGQGLERVSYLQQANDEQPQQTANTHHQSPNTQNQSSNTQSVYASAEEVPEHAYRATVIPEGLSETAAFHYHEGVTSDDSQEQFCFFDDADGTLDYSKDTQKFTFTSRDGRQHDMTGSMDTLRRAGRTFQSLDREEKSNFLGLHNFSTMDGNGRAMDFIAQRGQDGTTNFVSKLGAKAVGNVAAIATQKALKIYDDAMAAGQL